MNKSNLLQRLLQALIFNVLLLGAGGCQLPQQGDNKQEAFDYEQAVSFLIPELQRHCAFGSDLLQLTAESGSAELLQAAATALRRNGAAVSVAGESEESLSGRDPVFTPGSRRQLRLAEYSIDGTVLLSLALDDTTLHCSFVSYYGQVRPTSAVSVMRGTYGS